MNEQKTITHANYTNSDEEYQGICDFLNTLSKLDPNMMWESGRMNFWRYNIHAQKDPQGPFFRENTHLWRGENNEIVGLCISEYGKNDIFIEVMPQYRGIYPDMLRWINTVWAANRDEIVVDVFQNDAVKIASLIENGFAFQSHYENKRWYDLEQIDLDYELEDGFSIEAFSESNDYSGRVALVQNAFNNPNYTEKNLKGLVSSPDHINEYNLAVVSPEGKQVAYCIGWHEASSEDGGYVEPVGTHADYRKRGFAKAVIRECFSRMKANGIKVVEISSYAEPAVANYLYDSLSPYKKKEVHRYSK